MKNNANRKSAQKMVTLLQSLDFSGFQIGTKNGNTFAKP